MPRQKYKKIINKLIINKKVCHTCKSIVMCELCKRFGKNEGSKWYNQQKYYISE